MLKRFGVRIGLIGLAGLAVRWLAVLTYYRKLSPPPPDLTDNTWYWLQAKLLARGDGFANPLIWYKQCVIDVTSCATSHSAGKPPLYTSYLAIFHLLGLDSPLSMRLASGFLGTACVIGVGFLARRISGSERAGLIAACLAALYPNLWINDGLILSESLYAPLMVAVLWTAWRLIEEPGLRRAWPLGLAVGLACLTRSESQLLVIFIVLPVAMWVIRPLSVRRRLAVTGVTLAVALAVVAPWVALNLATFREPVFLSIGTGFVLDVSNCDTTYRGELIGYTDPVCSTDDWPKGADESEVDLFLRERPLRYIRDHADEVPKVVAIRVGRMWNIYRPVQGVDLDIFFERRGRWQSWAGLISYYAIGAAAVGGAVTLRRRQVSLVPAIGLIAMVTFTAASSMPITRYRVAAEVVWVVLGGIGLNSLWSRLRPACTSDPEAGASPSAEPDSDRLDRASDQTAIATADATMSATSAVQR